MAANDDRVSQLRKVRVVVLGGGTAGWMTAAALVSLIPAAAEVVLVESEAIGIVGVGEATLPHLRAFLTRLDIDERQFMAATNATFKLGIAFEDFGRIGDRYIHPFGSYGRALNGVGFHHYWLRSHHAGVAGRIDPYSVAVMAAEAGRIEPGEGARTDAPADYGYAYQFDATQFGPFLRGHAETRGAVRIEGRVTSVRRDPASGDVTTLELADGQMVEGDLFVDCSGFGALLLGQTMGADWEDWSEWLPCDRAVAVPCRSPEGPIEPYTRAVAMPAGWRWRIPLRNRVGNGYVYASAHCSDDEAHDALLGALGGEALAEPRVLRFRAGRRAQSWVGNVVGIGLASGFLEPLESTSIYLAQAAITELIERFPMGGTDARDRAGFNAAIDLEYDRIRDFLILHYHATTRDDTPFWRQMRDLEIPQTLADRLALWRQTSVVPSYTRGLFLEPSWIAVLIGQGVLPHGWDPRADIPEIDQLGRALSTLRSDVAQRVEALPLHDAVLPMLRSVP